MKEGEKPGKFLLPHGIILLEFGPYRIFMEGNPEGIQNQRPLGIMELSGNISLCACYTAGPVKHGFRSGKGPRCLARSWRRPRWSPCWTTSPRAVASARRVA